MENRPPRALTRTAKQVLAYCKREIAEWQKLGVSNDAGANKFRDGAVNALADLASALRNGGADYAPEFLPPVPTPDAPRRLTASEKRIVAGLEKRADEYLSAASRNASSRNYRSAADFTSCADMFAAIVADLRTGRL